MNYLLVDVMNLMWRAAHVTRGDNYTRTGLAAHILLNSLPSCAKKFNIDHVVFAYDGRSWRKSYDTRYKLNRKITEMAKTETDQEFTKMLFDMQADLRNFLEQSTNSTVLFNDILEADDLISGWIKHHPNDNHVILSSDSDFQQLLANNVSIYNGIDKTTTTLTSIVDEKGKPKVDKKGNIVVPDDPEYYLFEKIVRGDTSDNIRPSYPGVRKQGSKNKVGIVEAFMDRHHKGYAWNTFMNSTWTDEYGVDQKVQDHFIHNTLLIDLNAQPDHIQDTISNTINNVEAKSVPQIGIKFIKFCGKYQLVTLAQNSKPVVDMLAKSKK